MSNIKAVFAFCIGLFLVFSATISQAGSVITTMSGGSAQTLFVRSDGSLWGMGENEGGILGLGNDLYYTNSPALLQSSNVMAAAGGDGFSLFLKSDGSLWGMGANNNGELGDGTTTQRATPEMLVPGSVTAVVAGNAEGPFSLFLKSDGSLWGMGADAAGNLGNGTNTSVCSNQVMIMPGGVMAMAAGTSHALFVKTDGSLWAMGDNSNGELGNNTFHSTNIPIMIVPSGVVSVAAGDEFSMFVKSDGSLWGMGIDEYGELGDGGSDDPINAPEEILTSGAAAVSCGWAHTLLLKTNGSLWATGYCQSGQLGDGNSAANHVIEHYAFEQIVPSNVTAIAAGEFFSLFLKTDNSLWGMGDDTFSQLAGTASDIVYPTQITPRVAFTATPTNGFYPLAVQFNSPNVDNASNSIIGWFWSFGDGSTSTLENPTHTYTTNAIYSPTLTCTNSASETVFGTGPSITVASSIIHYTASRTNGVASLYVQFGAPQVDQAGNTITGWNWNFGDGATSALQNPSHTYSVAGHYMPSLTATNSNSQMLTGVGPSNITVLPAPTLVFTASTTNGPDPLTVQFTSPGVDSLGNTIVDWDWNFDDGSDDSSAQSVSHVFQSPGLYGVSLYVDDSAGYGFYATGPSINVTLPSLKFTACPATGTTPVTVRFAAPGVDSGGNTIIDWNWDFGDGIGTSTLQNPTYVYTSPGAYMVTLNVDNSNGDNFNATGPALNFTTGAFNSGLVVNGGFETGDFTGWETNSPSGNYDFDVDSYFALSGNYAADFYEEGSLDYISQALPTVAGRRYLLSFWLNSPDGEMPNEFVATWNGATLFDGVNMAGFGWTNIEFVVSATGTNTVLQFGAQDDPSALGLDDVSVISPEPGIGSFAVSGSNLVLCGTNGVAGQTYCTFASTNVALPLSQWEPVATNTLAWTGDFNVTLTNAVSPDFPQRYFVLKLR